jgi:nitric oxide reductase subunit C
MSLPAGHGKEIWQQNNCTSCHQLFGMGGFLGPDLTTVFSDSLRGPAYARAFLQNGGSRMPNFKFSEDEIDAVLAYLQYVDSNASTYKK